MALYAPNGALLAEANDSRGALLQAVHLTSSGTFQINPIESVTKFELKSNETDGWSEQTGVSFLIRRACVVSLSFPLTSNSYLLSPARLARVTYTGGYVLPGTAPDPGQSALPDDLEQAAVEQVAYWFRNRDKTGLLRNWPHGGTYEGFLPSALLLEVRAALKKYERWAI